MIAKGLNRKEGNERDQCGIRELFQRHRNRGLCCMSAHTPVHWLVVCLRTHVLTLA